MAILQQNDLQVQKIVTVQHLDPDGQLRDVRRITFMVREHGPFYLEVPAGGFSGAEVKSRLVAEATEILNLLE